MRPGQTCPDCGVGKLKEKHGKYGWFLGCSTFPSCNFVSRDINKGRKASDEATDAWLKEHGATIDPVI